MSIPEMIGVLKSEWRAYLRSGFLWKATGAYLTLVTVATLVTWPRSAIVGSPDLALTWNWFTYVALATLGYIALGLAADVFHLNGRVAPYEWVYYDAAHPVSVLCGQTLAILTFLSLQALLSLPIALVAHAAYPVGAASIAGTLFLLLSIIGCLIGVGLVIATGVTERSLRSVAGGSLYALFGILAFLLAGWIGPQGSPVAKLNPLGAVYHFQTISTAGASLDPFPWGAWIITYAAVFALLAGWALFRLWEWLPKEDGRTSPDRSRGESPPTREGLKR